MKKNLLFIACLFISGIMIAQEKYSVKLMTCDQKHDDAIYQLDAFLAAGINFAKTHGVTPYEYGKFVGAKFAPFWQPENNFDAFVKGVISHVDLISNKTDHSFNVKENTDGSVAISFNEKIQHRYFDEEINLASYSEFLDFLRGLYEPIADRMGATFKLEVRDSVMIYSLKKK